MKNKEKFASEIVEFALNCNKFGVCKHDNKLYKCVNLNCNDCLFKKDETKLICNGERIKWANEECVEQILTDKEKEYLSAVIKPFRDKVGNITKWIIDDEFIEINLTTQELEAVQLPYFEKDTMYKGMVAGKKYTLKDLGLEE